MCFIINCTIGLCSGGSPLVLRVDFKFESVVHTDSSCTGEGTLAKDFVHQRS